MERMLLQHRNEPVLYPMHLPDEIRIQVLRAGVAGEPLDPARDGLATGAGIEPWKAYRRRALDEAERGYLRELLRTARGNVGRASRLSGLSPSRLYDLFRKYGLPTRP